MKKLIILFAFLVFAFSVNAQIDTKTVLANMSAVYKNARTLSFNITYTYYQDVKSVNPLKISKGAVSMNGTKYFIVLDKVEMLRNDTFMVILNKEQKVLMIDSASATPPGNMDMRVSIDTLLKYIGETSITEKGNKYHIKFSNPENSETLIKETEVVVNKGTHLIEKITVYYKTIFDDEGKQSWNPKMTVDYSNVKVNGSIDTGVFSEARFIKKSGRKLLAIPAYKSYELINHLE